MRQKLPILISYGDKVYRTAGRRIPFEGENYIGKDGHIKVAPKHIKSHSQEQLIVREYKPEDFNQVLATKRNPRMVR